MPCGSKHTAAHARVDRGFTLVELMISVSLMSVVMLAMTLFMTATADAWHATDNTRKTSMNVSRISQRLEQVLRPALQVVTLPRGSTSPTAFMYWAYDGAGGSASGSANRGEIGLIVFNSATKTLLHYAPSTSFTAAQLPEATNTSLGDLTHASTITTLTQMSFLQLPEVIAGPNVQPSLASSGATLVSSVKLETAAISGARPIVRYQVGLQTGQGEWSQNYAGSIVLRTSVMATNIQ